MRGKPFTWIGVTGPPRESGARSAAFHHPGWRRPNSPVEPWAWLIHRLANRYRKRRAASARTATSDALVAFANAGGFLALFGSGLRTISDPIATSTCWSGSQRGLRAAGPEPISVMEGTRHFRTDVDLSMARRREQPNYIRGKRSAIGGTRLWIVIFLLDILLVGPREAS